MSEQSAPSQPTDLHFDESVAPLPRPTVPAVEAILGRPIHVLDHGFVRLVDYMGSDAAIVQAARVSYGLGTRKASEDAALIRYLLRNKHTSPFEMIEVKLHVKAPIFVARQWLRHRTACLAGDAVLSFDLPAAPCRARQHHGMTIAQFYRLWHEGSTHAIPMSEPLFLEREASRIYARGDAWHAYARHAFTAHVSMRERLQQMHLRMCDEATGEIRHTRVVDIWQNGVKPVFKVTLENGKSLKMTKDHRCLTERGWLTLEQATGVRLREDGGVTWGGNVPAFATNGVPLYQSAEWLAARGSRGRCNSELAEGAKVSSMTVRAGKRWPRTTRLVRHWSKIARIEYAGEEMTYDLAVAGPYHNFVANGFIVHNSVNELSGRYSILPDELYLPEDTQISFQSADNKQGRSPVEVDPALKARVRALLLAGQESAYATYQELLDANIARELARIALPVAVYSEWYWKLNLHNLFHFLELRLDDHAQYEIRRYAEAIALIVERLAPVAYQAFVDYGRDAVRLSATERDLVGRLLRGEPVGPADWQRLGKRERGEFARKFGLTPDQLVAGTQPREPANGHAPAESAR